MTKLFKNISKLFEKDSTQKAFEDYLKARKDFLSVEKKIKKLKKQEYKNRKEINALEFEKNKLFQVKCEHEKKLVDVQKGMFLGIGVQINVTSLMEEVIPVYLEWKKLVNHYFVYGTSQVGKSRLLANHVRQMILNNWNVIVIDPKGGEGQEILSWIVEFAGEALRTEDLFYIAPVYSDYTDCLNPLYSLANEEIASMVQLLCKGGNNSDSDFFADYSYKVVLAILYSLEFLETVVDPDEILAEEKINREMINYYRLLELKGENSVKYDTLNKIILPDVATRMNLKKNKRYNKKNDEIQFAFDRKLITFKELAYYSNFNNLQMLIMSMSTFPIPYIEDDRKLKYLKYLKNEAIELMRDLKAIDESFFIKVSTSLTTLLTQLSSGKIGQLFCTVKINPLVNRLYRKDKGLICVVQPAPLKFQKVSEMVLKIIFKMFESVFGVIGSSGRGMTTRVGLIIDEAKAAMYPGIEELYNKAAQLGMTIGGYTQSRADLVYKLGEDLAEVVEDCVNTTFTLRTNSIKAREYIASGFGTVRQNTFNYTADNSLVGGRFMVDTVDEDIVKPHHLKELNIGEGFVQHAKESYRMEFPYQDSPHGSLVMPQLKEEEMIQSLTELEVEIENQIRNIDELNSEYLEKFGEEYE
jgi:hypothetical protein